MKLKLKHVAVWRAMPKIFLVMKLIAIILFIALTQVHARGYGQTITIHEKNVSVEKVLLMIEKQSDYHFIYDSKLDILKSKTVNINADRVTIKDILDECLTNLPVSYIIVQHTIALKGNKNVVQLQKAAAAQQAQKVTGSVTDDKGEPLPGVNVVEKNTANGTTTDVLGNYSINVSGPNAVLVFSFVGTDSQEVTVGSQTKVNVQLTSKASDLNEVVVIGYGTARKSELVGASSSVSVKDMKNQPSSRVDELLQGRSPGVNVQLGSAAPNGGVTIRVRGSNSIQGNNDPLVVIDGFINGDLASVNPNDIASIEVLKDASATAIYGSRGANGVVLVTTKQGTPNKVTVQYNGYMNFTSLRKKMDLMNAAQYAQTVDENRAELKSPTIPFSQAQIDAFKVNGGTDWQDQVFRNAVQQSHQVSVAGGSDKSNYFVSGAYVDNQGIILNSSFKRYSVRANQETKISKRVTAGVNLFVTKSIDHPSQTGGGQDSSPTQGALLWSPTAPVYGPDGKYTLPLAGVGPPAVFNPVALALEPIRNNVAYRSELNSYLTVNIIKGLTAKFQFGYRLNDAENDSYSNTKPAGGVGNAVASINNSRGTTLQNTNQLNYVNRFGKHDLNITAVYEQSREINTSNSAGSQGYATDSYTYNNLGIGSIITTPTSNFNQRDIQSGLARISYGYNDKYQINVAGRYDGSSVFGENHKWGFFPSAGAAWRVNREDFLKNVSQISNLKLRASYGVTGSQALPPYATLASLGTRAPYDISGTSNSVGVGLGTIANPDLKWEKTKQFNVGIDLGLFNERLIFNADYYDKETSDLLLNVPLPATSGYSGVTRNVGQVQNRGFELNLTGNALTGAFRWTTNINFAVNKNKVVALANGGQEIVIGTTGFPNFGNTIFLEVGQPLGVLKGYIQDGIWGTADAAKAASYGTIPGAPKYRDVDNNGKIDGNDIAVMGNTQPKFTYGWTNTFSYKGLDLNVFLQGSYGNKVYNETRIRSERSSSDADATSVLILNRWSPTNQNTNVPSFSGSSTHEFVQSSRWMEDGSYLRFKTITLGYNLPKSLLSKVKVAAVRVYVSGVNLITFTKYTGYDPEAATSPGTPSTGVDQAPYPSQKMYTVGANVSF